MNPLIYLAHRRLTTVADQVASIDAKNFAETSATTLSRKPSSPLLARQELSRSGGECRESAHDLDWRKYGGAGRQSVSSHL